MRIAGVGTLISSGLVFGYLGGRAGTAYASVAYATCSAVPTVGEISTDDSFNAAVAAVNAGYCNVIDIAAGFTFVAPPATISSPYDDSLAIVGLDVDDSVLDGNGGQGIAIEVGHEFDLSVSTLAFTAFDDTVGTSQSALSLRALGPVDVALSDVSFTHNYSGGSGGAVYVWSSYYPSAVTIDGDSYFGHNTARLSAGALFTKGAVPMDDTLTITGATFADNTSLGTGGGEGGGAVQASVVHATNTEFLRNEAVNQGGALSVGVLTTSDVLFQDDSAPFGGAIIGNYLSIGSGTEFLSNEASNRGGAIQADGVVTLDDANFKDNHAAFDGGGIFMASGSLESYGSFFSGNKSLGGAGGAISTTLATVETRDDSFSGNTASGAGGAIFTNSVGVHAIHSDFASNSAYTNSGGAISSGAPGYDGVMLLENCTFDNNYSGYDGGAVRTPSGFPIHATGVTFAGNNSHHMGGAIFSDDSVIASDDTFVDNHAQALSSKGGGIFVSGNLEVMNSRFTDDTASGRGGAVYSYGATSTVAITNSSFTGNASVTEDGGAVATKGDAHVYDSTFSLNDAFSLGGAIFARGNATLADNDFAGNQAGGAGGAVYSYGNLDDTASTWDANHSDYRGGAAGSRATMTVNASNFTGNFSANGGAVYSLGELHVTDAYFADDTASATGGALFSHGPAYISYSTFTRNEAANGGATFTNDDTTSITNVTMVGNSVTTGTGGAVRTVTGPIRLRFSTLVGNEALYGSAVGTNGASSLTQVSFFASVVAGDSGPLCDNLNPSPYHYTINATALSSYSFATDTSCGSSADSINTTFSTMSSLGFDDTTLTTDDSTGQEVLIPNPTSVLVNNVLSSVALGNGVPFDQLLASRAARSDDAFTTIGAVQVRDLTISSPSNVTVSPGATATFSVEAQPGVGTSLDYQWEQSTNNGVSWSTMPGQTSNTLTLTNVSAGYNGRQYRVLATDVRNEPVASAAATLTVSSPDPGTAPSAPRDPSAIAGDAKATVTWTAPASYGGSAITTYEVRNDVDGTTCQLTVGPTTPLECTLTGLTNGRAYRFSVRALNATGWSSWSAWSAAVTPQPPEPPPSPTITIVGSREHRTATVTGVTTELAGKRVRAMVKVRGQIAYAPGSTRVVNDNGRFTWTRSTAKKVYVYFVHGDTTSNRVIIPALRRP